MGRPRRNPYRTRRHLILIVGPVSRGRRPYRRLLAPGGRMAAMAIGSPADLAYLLASRIHGRRRVRFILMGARSLRDCELQQ